MNKTVLILGSTGRFGRHAAEAFWNAGWGVRPFDRARDTLPEAAMGADIIVAAWNPAYADWADQLLGLHHQVQEAARVSGATVILPGNVYVFGAQTPAPWGVNSPHAAKNPLGQLRIEMEQSYRDSGVKTIVLRAGDFLDTEVTDSWLDRVILKDLAKGRFTYPGRLDAPHAWAWLPDLARAAVMLADQHADLQRYTDIPFPGYTLTGGELAAAVETALGKPLRVRQLNWWPIKLASPVWPNGQKLLEMRYLWDTPHWLDGAAFDRICPGFRATPLEEATPRLIQPHLRDRHAAGRRLQARAAEPG